MGLSVLLHGFHGTGKSTLASKVPGPRLVLDAEGGSNWLEGKKVQWTNLDEAPPQVDDNTTVLVNVVNVETLMKAWSWLETGKHPFNSVVLDSLSEMQKRFVDRIAGTNQMKQEQCGELLRVLEKFVRDLKDLKIHPVRPVQAVVVVCGSQKKDGEPIGPQLQGALANSLPFYFDLVGYCEIVQGEGGKLDQHVLILPLGGIVAKDRPGFSRRLGAVLTNPDITALIAQTNQG